MYDVYVGKHVWESEDSFVDSGLSSHLYMASKNWTEDIGLGWQVLLTTEPAWDIHNFMCTGATERQWKLEDRDMPVCFFLSLMEGRQSCTQMTALDTYKTKML